MEYNIDALHNDEMDMIRCSEGVVLLQNTRRRLSFIHR